MPEAIATNMPKENAAPADNALTPVSVRIVRGDLLSVDEQQAAIDILYQGFRRKLCSLLLLSKSSSQIKRVLPEVIDFSQSLVAVEDAGDHPADNGAACGRVCGVLLMNLGGKDYLQFNWRVARREFGLAGAVYRRVNYWIVNGKRRERAELNIQAVCVRRRLRGRGIGAQLIHAAESHAAGSGYDKVSLEVVDSNPRAKRLYERIGFALTETCKTWPYTARAGFHGYDCMVKRLPATSASSGESRHL